MKANEDKQKFILEISDIITNGRIHKSKAMYNSKYNAIIE